MDIADAFRLQAAACDRLGSPLYARLVAVAAENIAGEGALAPLVAGWEGHPVHDAVALRVMAGVHRAALTGAAPALAEHYPTMRGEPRWPACSEAFLATIEANPAELTEALTQPPQTNEIGRSGVLIGGLAETAGMTGLPLRLLEIGASAGLNLLLDGFHYDFGGSRWGDPTSPVAVATAWSGFTPALAPSIDIAERSGCDVNPLDPAQDDDAARLRSFVWADQVDRFRRLDGAIALARRRPVPIDSASAESWLAERLEDARPGTATVVMQSVVTQYLSPEVRRRVASVIGDAGERATDEAPLAWLRFEPAKPWFKLQLSLWPARVDLRLATADPHGRWAEWFIGSDAG